MKIVLFQPPYPWKASPSDASACMGWMRENLDRLKPGEPDLVLLPEYANAPGLTDGEMVRDFAQSQGAEFIETVATSAKRLGCLVVLPVIMQSGVRWFNRTMVFNSDGCVVSTYDKVHLTDVETEDFGLTPGATAKIFNHDGIRIGLATCFDLYFPEHFESMAAQGVDVVVCGSYQRSETPQRNGLIAQVRALDSGVYLARASYAMEDPNAGGRSLVAEPTGELRADAGGAPCVLGVDIEPTRKFMKPASHGRPVVEHRSLIESHRRPAVYRPHPERVRHIKQAPYPWLCAHRGLSHACPENTLPAFAGAIACGVHEIEFDLRTSRDGVPVVCHDRSVDRTTNGSGKVAELDWKEIRSLDAGVYLGEAWAGVRMPRVEELLELVDGRVGMNIHIQGVGPDGMTIKRVCDLLNAYGLTDIAYLALGREEDMRTARDYAPEIPRACLISQHDSEKCISIAEKWACHRIQFCREVTREQIQRAHDAGLVANLFESDDPEDGMHYVQRGIDVILTNRAHFMIGGGLDALQGDAVDQGMVLGN